MWKKNCCSYCDKLKRQLQETVDELKSVKLINNVLQTELNSAHIAKHVWTNNVNNVSGENYGEKGGTDKNSQKQVVTGQKKPRRQNYPQKRKQIAISNRFASLRLQESAVGHPRNDLVTSKISEGKERSTTNIMCENGVGFLQQEIAKDNKKF